MIKNTLILYLLFNIFNNDLKFTVALIISLRGIDHRNSDRRAHKVFTIKMSDLAIRVGWSFKMKRANELKSNPLM